MEFTVITNRTHLKVVHNMMQQDGGKDTLQLVYKKQEIPVYNLYQ